uniref:Cytochrome b6-f complex subunit 6 n=1 Tax=Lobosphaera incisa TaxID=312850 RepID=A0A097KM24_9CHLO|nr:subunit VI of cytochrome b6/f complex [Lobosphaera incisa]AIT94228.1 subunit VI of cytochrome b6/f complex [Lobosphaera incisa]
MITIISYIALLSASLVFTLVVYLGLLKVKLI